MTMITPSYLGETIEYSSLHACRSTLEDPSGEIDGRRRAAVQSKPLTRGGAVWQLVGLITRRSQVQILSPQPTNQGLAHDRV